jgi:predicted nucleic acid-binding Zn ribbon protein
MPIYVYRCPICDYTKDVVLSYQEVGNAKIMCEMCREEVNLDTEMKHLIGSNVGVIFKDKGFYSTDNKPVEKILKGHKESEWK